MASVTRCKNPACEFHDRCRFAHTPVEQTLTTSTNQEQALSVHADCPQLTIGPNGLGRIDLHQGIGPDLEPLISELEGLDPGHVPGLMMHIRSGGGVGSWGTKLIRAITAYLKKGGAAVSLIEVAYSCAFEVAMVCTRAFVLPDGLGGGVGVAEYFCDGWAPIILKSAQTPMKLQGGMNEPPTAFKVVTPGEIHLRQESLNVNCEHVYSMIAAARRMGVGDVQRAMRGQAKLPEQLKAGGFVDDILTEEEAGVRLWLLTINRHNQDITNGLALRPY